MTSITIDGIKYTVYVYENGTIYFKTNDMYDLRIYGIFNRIPSIISPDTIFDGKYNWVVYGLDKINIDLDTMITITRFSLYYGYRVHLFDNWYRYETDKFKEYLHCLYAPIVDAIAATDIFYTDIMSIIASYVY